jgi:hypothetical protein
MKDPKLFEQFADEERVYEWDFSKFPEQATPDIVAAVMTIIENTTTTPLVVGTPDFSEPPIVAAELKGGEVNAIYIVKCRVETTEGSFLDVFLKLKIVPPPDNVEA